MNIQKIKHHFLVFFIEKNKKSENNLTFNGKLHNLNLKQIDCWHSYHALHQSYLIAHIVSFLMLLPSGPDMIRRAILYQTLISTYVITTQHNQVCPESRHSAPV